jgi:hypothetical protein
MSALGVLGVEVEVRRGCCVQLQLPDGETDQFTPAQPRGRGHQVEQRPFAAEGFELYPATMLIAQALKPVGVAPPEIVGGQWFLCP